jgi:uncharacterized small protein (DUF1192 family)
MIFGRWPTYKEIQARYDDRDSQIAKLKREVERLKLELSKKGL